MLPYWIMQASFNGSAIFTNTNALRRYICIIIVYIYIYILQYEMRKCSVCDCVDIENECHVTAVCQQIKDFRTK